MTEEVSIRMELNLLLLSTTYSQNRDFINSFANYLFHDTYEDAINDTHCLIPYAFDKDKIYQISKTNSNLYCTGLENTDVQTVTFNVNNKKIRIICIIMENRKDYRLDLKFNGILLLLEDEVGQMEEYMRFFKRQSACFDKFQSERVLFVNISERHFNEDVFIQWSKEIMKSFPLNSCEIKERTIAIASKAFRHLTFANNKSGLLQNVEHYEKCWSLYRANCLKLLNCVDKYSCNRKNISTEKALEAIEAITELLAEHLVIRHRNLLETKLCIEEFLKKCTFEKDNQFSIVIQTRCLDKTCVATAVCSKFFKTTPKNMCTTSDCLYKSSATEKYIARTYHDTLTSYSKSKLRDMIEERIFTLKKEKSLLVNSIALFHLFKKKCNQNATDFFKAFIEAKKDRDIYHENLVCNPLLDDYSYALWCVLENPKTISNENVSRFLNELCKFQYVKSIINNILGQTTEPSPEKPIDLNGAPQKLHLSKKINTSDVQQIVTTTPNENYENTYSRNAIVKKNIPTAFGTETQLQNTRKDPSFEKQTGQQLTNLYKQVFEIIDDIKQNNKSLYETEDRLKKQNENLLCCSNGLNAYLSQKTDPSSNKLLKIFTGLQGALNKTPI